MKPRYREDVNRAGRGKCVAVGLSQARALTEEYRAVQVCGDAVLRKPDPHAPRKIGPEPAEQRGGPAARDTARVRALPLHPQPAAQGRVVALRLLEPPGALPGLARLRHGRRLGEREYDAHLDGRGGAEERSPFDAAARRRQTHPALDAELADERPAAAEDVRLFQDLLPRLRRMERERESRHERHGKARKAGAGRKPGGKRDHDGKRRERPKRRNNRHGERAPLAGGERRAEREPFKTMCYRRTPLHGDHHTTFRGKKSELKVNPPQRSETRSDDFAGTSMSSSALSAGESAIPFSARKARSFAGVS